MKASSGVSDCDLNDLRTIVYSFQQCDPILIIEIIRNNPRQLTSVVPIIEGNDDDNVPQVVRMSQVVHFAAKPTFRDPGDVEKEGKSD